jgi:hypothetical protein
MANAEQLLVRGRDEIAVGDAVGTASVSNCYHVFARRQNEALA